MTCSKCGGELSVFFCHPVHGRICLDCHAQVKRVDRLASDLERIGWPEEAGIAPEASRLPVVTRKVSDCVAPAPKVESGAVGQENSRSVGYTTITVAAWNPMGVDRVGKILDEVYASDRLLFHRPDSRLSSAMAGMANVMCGVRESLSLSRTNFALFEYEQRHDQQQMLNEHERRDVSEQWSAKVREGVAKLKPPGPVVSCQGDWGDD